MMWWSLMKYDVVVWCFMFLLDNIIRPPMLRVADQRQHCSSVRTRRSESAPLQQCENEGKQYRTLLSIFTDNINAAIRNHRTCLVDADTHPKIRASRQETQGVMDQLQKVYNKMEQKLMREALNRNVIIKKSIDQFAETYRNAFPEWNWHKNADSYETMAQSQDYFSKEYLSQRRKSNAYSTPKRPQSSKQPKNNKISLIHQAYSTYNSISPSLPYKIKTVMAHAQENPQGGSQKEALFATQRKLISNPSRLRKMQMSGKNRYENAQLAKQKEYEEFLFDGEQIMINEGRCRQSAKQFQAWSQNPGSVRGQSTKRKLNLKFSQRKSIIQLQKMQIQSRIMMMSSVLSVNLVQPQGYRPKSRCWQNNFN